MRLAHGKALGWEIWRRGWYWFHWFLVAMTAPTIMMMLLFYTISFRTGSAAFMRDAFESSFRIILLVEMMMFIAMLAQLQGGEVYELIVKRYYYLPIATRDLIAWRMMIGAVAIAVMHVGVALIVGASSGIWMPIALPILFIICAAASIQALILILSGHVFLRVLAGVGFGLGTFWWLNKAFRATPAGVAWPDVGYGQILALCGLIAISFATATVGAARQRRGDAEGMVGLREWWDRLMLRLRTRRTGFDSPRAAQLWFERRTRAGSYICVIAMPAVLSVVFLCTGASTRDVLEISFGMSLLAMVVAAFPLGILIGHTGKLKAGITMGVFRATWPLTDRDMARGFLRSALREIAGSWLALAVLLGVVHVVLLHLGEAEAIGRFWNRIFPSHESPLPLWLRVPLDALGLFVVQWSLLCLGISFALSGRMALIVTVIAVALVSFFLIPFTTHQPGLEWLWYVLDAVGVTLVAIAAAVLIAGWRRGYVKGWITAVPVVLGALALIVYASLGARSLELEYLVAIALASLMVTLPFASAPLALSLNRHR